jgi:riboflavin synthase
MFTGIVTHSAAVAGIADAPLFKRLTLAIHFDDTKPGDSVAVNGVCLTVAEMTRDTLAFDVIAETLDKTNLGQLNPGDRVHIERALRAGDRFDGHFVQGHVDGTALIVDRKFTQSECRLTLETPDHLAKYLVPKGSVALDGVSLTIASLAPPRFDVALIPTTLELTTLGHKPVGALVNFEADMLAKTIVTFLEQRQSIA